MLEMFDRIKERNFGRNIEFKGYTGNKLEDWKLLDAGIGVYSLFVDGVDMNISIYDFNDGRKAELDEYGEYDDQLELDRIITNIIRLKFDN